MTEERVLTLALSPAEARLVSVMFALSMSLLKGDRDMVVVIKTGAMHRLLQLSDDECFLLQKKLIDLDVEAATGPEREVAELARLLVSGGGANA